MADTSSNQSFQMKPGFRVPSRTGQIGMYLFLVSLFMLFAAGLLGYLLIRVTASEKFPLGSLRLPTSLWISTILVVIASITIQFALGSLRREHQAEFRRWLMVTVTLAVAFLIVQTPSLAVLLHDQQALRQQKLALYGLVFCLILLHAIHVIGGVIALLRTSQQAHKGIYDHEHYQPVRHVALYWHFLDGVWLTMFFTLLLVG